MGSKQASVADKFIAERIRTYRRQNGVSQSDLAQKLGITFQQVQKYERGANRVGAGRLFEIANIFNIPIQTFFPVSEEFLQQVANRTTDAKEVSDFMLSIDGWQLCRAFLHVRDLRTRKKVIALVQELAQENLA